MQSGWRSGPRLRDRPPASPECWRCAADERVLREYALSLGGKVIGSVLVCGPCIRTIRPLNPDPLHVPEAA
jgi:hypothetical protein